MCDHAFLDRDNRLCVIGMIERLSVSEVPFALGQVTLVARLVDVKTVDEIELCITVVTPLGTLAAPTDADALQLDIVEGHIFATLRGIPLMNEGVYRFQVSLSGQPALAVEIPVLTTQQSVLTDVH